jgi:hypothetical protein
MMWNRPVTVGRSCDPVVTTVEAITVSPSYAVRRCDVRLTTMEWVCTTAAFEAEAGSEVGLGDLTAAGVAEGRGEGGGLLAGDDETPEDGLLVG